MTSAEQFGVVFAPDVVREDADGRAATPARARTPATAARQPRSSPPRHRWHATTDLVVQARTDQPSFVALDQDVQTFGQFANLLPLLFLVAAVLGAFILLSRLVSAQRAVIGTLAANGIAPRTLRRHYLGYGLIAGGRRGSPGCGAAACCSAGGSPRSTPTRSACRCTSRRCTPRRMVVAVAAGVAATALAAWGPARAAARDDAGRGDAGRARRSRFPVTARTGRAADAAPPGALADGRARARPQPAPRRCSRSSASRCR